MPTVTSADGTPIAYERTGSGPALVLVDGALCHREFGPSRKLAAQLESDFTVYIYDRRGRGGSGDAAVWSPEREVEDLAAVIDAAGGSAGVYGISSGGVLALDAAERLAQITSVAIYEAPLVIEPEGNVLPADFLERLRGQIDAGRRGAAVKQFMDHVGTPRLMTAVMRRLPMWSKLESVAGTLAYDIALVEDLSSGRPLPSNRWASVRAPVLVIHGGNSPDWMGTGAKGLATLVSGEHQTLPGQNHMVKPKVLAPKLGEFFAHRAAPAEQVAA